MNTKLVHVSRLGFGVLGDDRIVVILDRLLGEAVQGFGNFIFVKTG